MKILIVSDSHGNNGPLRTAILKEKPDMLIHLGDSETPSQRSPTGPVLRRLPASLLKETATHIMLTRLSSGMRQYSLSKAIRYTARTVIFRG